MQAQLKGRAARRATVVRKSLLLDLARPWGAKATRRLTERQARAAYLLDGDLTAKWGPSPCKTVDFGAIGGGGENGARLIVDRNLEAARRIERLQNFLKMHERRLLGAIERNNWQPKGGLGTLEIETCHRDEETRVAVINGRVQALLESVAEFYDAMRLDQRRAA